MTHPVGLTIIGPVLYNAAANGDLAIITCLLDHAGEKLFLEEKGQALCVAVENKELAVVMRLLSHPALQIISTSYKEEVLRIAKENGALDIEAFLNQHLSEQMPVQVPRTWTPRQDTNKRPLEEPGVSAPLKRPLEEASDSGRHQFRRA